MPEKVTTLTQLGTVATALNDVIKAKIPSTAKTSTISATSTNEQIPGAKAVYDLVTESIPDITVATDAEVQAVIDEVMGA